MYSKNIVNHSLSTTANSKPYTKYQNNEQYTLYEENKRLKG